MGDDDGSARSEDRPVAYVDRTLEALIPRFLERRLADTATIETLVSQGDFDTIQSMAHSIKGSGGGYGFDPITVIGSQIEDAAKAADGSAVIVSARKMRAYIEVVEVVFVDE
ncbi:MAG: Hpt domain-containing protein [Actinobacteria bacterium]|nr:MAG: Hpt domain-containing protein [Actinomycetota bacterium]